MALWFARLPTDRLSRKSLFSAPLVISHKANNALYIYALEARAQRLGLYKGQPLANARAMVQPLQIVTADERADAELLEAIADWCDRFTPLVSLDGACGLFLDITGAAHLFGGERAMLAMVTQRIATHGFAVQGAIAGTSLAARALARFVPGTIVPGGGEAQNIAPLPIAALDCDDKLLRALRHAGLKTIGQVAERLHSELAERLGKRFVTRLKVMLGAEEQPLQPRRPLPDLMAEQRFAEPVVTQEVITASLSSLAESLGGILERQGRGLRLLEAVFFRADGKVERIAIKTGEALRDPKVMLRLLRQRLDALNFENLAERVYYVLQLCRLREIRKIEGLDDTLLDFFALCGIISRNKNCVWRHRPPECFRLHGDDLQGFFERYGVQIDFYSARCVVRVEQHIDAGQLADGFEDDLAILGLLHGHRHVRDGSEFDRCTCILETALKDTWLLHIGLRCSLPLLNQAVRDLDFLLCDGARGVDFGSLLEFCKRFLQPARLT